MFRPMPLIAACALFPLSACAQLDQQDLSAAPDYTFTTWKEAIDHAPCSAFQHVWPGVWKMTATVEITGLSDNPAERAWGQSIHVSGLNKILTDVTINKPLETDVLDRRCIADD